MAEITEEVIPEQVNKTPYVDRGFPASWLVIVGAVVVFVLQGILLWKVASLHHEKTNIEYERKRLNDDLKAHQDIKAELKELQANMPALTAEYAALKTQTNQDQLEYLDLTKKIAVEKGHLEKLRNATHDEEERKDQLKKKVEDLASDSVRLQRRADELKAEIKQNTDAEQKLNTTNAKLEDSRRQLAETEGRYKQLSTLSMQDGRLEAVVTELERSSGSLSQINKGLDLKGHESIRNIETATAASVADMNRIGRQWSSSLGSISQSLKDEVNALNQTQNGFVNTVGNLRTGLDGSAADLQLSISLIKQAQDRMQAHVAAWPDLKKSVEDIKSQLNQLEKELKAAIEEVRKIKVKE